MSEKVYNWSALNKQLQPWLAANERDGFVYLNSVGFLAETFPQHAPSLRRTYKQLIDTAELDDSGVYQFTDQSVRGFLEAFKYVCREYRANAKIADPFDID